MAATKLDLPVIDLLSSDDASIAASIRRACVEHGFFYIVNHGVDEELISRVFDQSRKFFSLPIGEKMKLKRDERTYRGYTPLYHEALDRSHNAKGDAKESFYIAPEKEGGSGHSSNQWPSEDTLPFWRVTMECFHEKVLAIGKKVISLIALALNLDETFFEEVGALHDPMAFLRLIRYPGHLTTSSDGVYGASRHSDYGMITLLLTDGVPGLQICREKDSKLEAWEDVNCVNGAFIINVGDMLERWTNCLFRSTMHRVVCIGQERYSVAFFLDPNSNCMVECLECCCSETCPPKFPPIRSGDYLVERFRVTYGSI